MIAPVIALHGYRCTICRFRARDAAKFAAHRCHPSLRAENAGLPAIPTTGRRAPLRLVGTPPTGSPA